jgi:hypothetical protein
VQAVVPRPDIAPLLTDNFVAVAGDADDPHPGVQELLLKLRNASMLPIVVLADAEGGFLGGGAGGFDPERLKGLLEEALPKKDS